MEASLEKTAADCAVTRKAAVVAKRESCPAALQMSSAAYVARKTSASRVPLLRVRRPPLMVITFVVKVPVTTTAPAAVETPTTEMVPPVSPAPGCRVVARNGAPAAPASMARRRPHDPAPAE